LKALRIGEPNLENPNTSSNSTVTELFEDILGICAADMSSTEEKNVLTCWGNNIHVGKKQFSNLVIRIPQVFIVNFQLQASKLLQNSDPYRL
jgi:hypothetical protein